MTALVVLTVSVSHAWPPLASRSAPAAPLPQFGSNLPVNTDAILTVRGHVLGDPVFPSVTVPAPVARRTYSPWSGEIETIAHREREPGWTQPGELADRLDALGGLPLGYTRWRNTGVRWTPEPFPSFGFAIHTGY